MAVAVDELIMAVAADQLKTAVVPDKPKMMDGSRRIENDSGSRRAEDSSGNWSTMQDAAVFVHVAWAIVWLAVLCMMCIGGSLWWL